jgi:ribosomal protein S18 acetylase RimI-like enzyme
MGELSVRRARITDLDGLLSLYGELAGFREEAAPGDSVSSRSVLEEILADRSRHLMVATVDGRLAGTADLVVVANLTHRGKPWAIVENVIVASTLRRAGVGRELMRHLIDVARAAGCCKLQLLSAKHRTEAHSLYRSLDLDSVAEGFKIYFDA